MYCFVSFSVLFVCNCVLYYCHRVATQLQLNISYNNNNNNNNNNKRLDKIRSEVIRKELEVSGIQDVRPKHKQNWINHPERMDNTRLPKHALNYKPRGRRDRGRPRKRWQRVDAGTVQST